MKDYGSTINTILEKLECGQYIFIKCADHSELFIHKVGMAYGVTKDRTFMGDVEWCTGSDFVAKKLSGMRGHGTYVLEE